MNFTSPLLLLLLPVLLAGTIWAWAGHAEALSPRRIISLAVRCAIVTLLVCALAGLTWDRPRHAQAVAFVVDLSASTRSGQAYALQFVNQALHQRPAGDLAAIVAGGANALVEQPPARLTGITAFQSVVDPNFTNLEAGLQLGGALLPPDYSRRVVLLSDGRQNLGDAISEARALHSAHLTVDVVPIKLQPGPEVQVDSVDAPGGLRTGQNIPLSVQVTSTVATSSSAEILEDGAVVRTAKEEIGVGTSILSYTLPPAGAGEHVLQVILQPAIDTLSQNNQGSAVIDVSGPPAVLVVEGYPGAGRNVVAALQAGHVAVTRQLGNQVSADLTVLQRYAAVVLVDVPADELGQDVMSSLRGYVADLGKGLVAIGGENSYAVGNYGSTPLEALLPVNMDLPKRKDLPTAAVVLIIESLESNAGVNISKRAGEGVIGLLTPRDQVAVSDAANGLVVPLQYVTAKAAIDATIDRMDPGDPPSYGPFLQQAALTLEKARARIKHIILLGDGDAGDNYKPLLKQIAALGIQVSTIETNATTADDIKTMQDIAAWGGGKFYAANSVTAIPRIFLKVARTVAHTSVIEANFEPLVVADSAVLHAIQAVPPLGGYVVTTAKPLSTVVLASPKGDPILAQWQYGLGRAVAWTSDSLGRWSSAWLADAHARSIWLNMINWVLPPPRASALNLTTQVNGTQATIAVDTPPGSAFSSVKGRETGPTGSHTLTLPQTAPYHFETTIPVSDAGAYLLDLQASAKGAGQGHGLVSQVSGGLIVPYAPDYRDSGTDLATLQAIAAAGGGRVLARPSNTFADNLQATSVPTPLQWPLLLLALLLFPLDVGVRRLALSRDDVWALWHAVTSPVGRQSPGAEHPALARIRERRRWMQPLRGERDANGRADTPVVVHSTDLPLGDEAAEGAAPLQTGLHLKHPVAVEPARLPTPAGPAGAPGQDEQTGSTAARRLLEAKRRRRS